MSPYPKSSASALASLSLTPLSGTFSPNTSDSLPTTSKGKGKSSTTSFKASVNEKLASLNDDASESQYKLGVLRNKCKSLKIHAYMRRREMAHMEAEAEAVHHHTIEQKQLDIDLVKQQQELIRLKCELAKLESGKGTPAAEPSSQAWGSDMAL